MLRGGHHGQIRRIHDNPGLVGKGGSLKGQGHGLKDTLFILSAVDGTLCQAVDFRGKVRFQVLECIDGPIVVHRLLVPDEDIQGFAGNQGGYLGQAGILASRPAVELAPPAWSLTMAMDSRVVKVWRYSMLPRVHSAAAARIRARIWNL